jgi:protein involved in polysaccharide export with SLBB domain
VEGEVAVPGIYPVKPGETLRQVVERAGGFSPDAYLYGAEMTRESLRREQQARLDEIALRAERELDFATAERLARALGADDVAATKAQAETQRVAVARLRTLKATGRLVLAVGPQASRPGDLPELVLEDGDRLFVPTRPSTIGVYGAVYNQTSLIYAKGKRVDDYLEQAGGPTRTADAGSTYVLRANGSVVSRRQSGWFASFGRTELMPSDAVVVPEEYQPTSWIKELKDWSQIFYQFGLGVAAVRLLR